MGPSLLTMPQVSMNWFAAVGRKRSDYLKVHPLPCTCRYRWTDGTVIDESEAFWQRADVAPLLRYRRALEISATHF